MITITILIFIVGYLAIAMEHSIHINKAASAMLTGALCWLMYFMSGASHEAATERLLHHMGDIASILFFLLGAMTIVELIDCYDGFDIITDKINTTSKRKLLLIVSVLTFFLSALLDNLTTAIVMTSLIQRLLSEKEDRLWFAGMVVIAANAGGVWSVLGDVTTTMLWIGGQVTAENILLKTFIPALLVCAIPLGLLMLKYGKDRFVPVVKETNASRRGRFILFIGIALLLFVPAFKIATGMPPFMGMLIAVSLIWMITAFLQLRSGSSLDKFTVTAALEKIDTPSILFFLGILLAVASLQEFGILGTAATALQNTFGNDYAIGTALGLLSALVDNVPLVAAAQGMYDMTQYPTDHSFWEFLALTTGTGGSAIIIGSAAGVAVMGIEKISFTWYLKKISPLALLGFAAGAAAYIGQEALF